MWSLVLTLALAIHAPSAAATDPLRSAGPGDDGNAQAAIGLQCAQSAPPVDLPGRTILVGPFPSREQARAAGQSSKALTEFLAEAFWPGFECPGCPEGSQGCVEALEVLEPVEGGFELRKGPDGWCLVLEFDSGAVSVSCGACVDIGVSA